MTSAHSLPPRDETRVRPFYRTRCACGVLGPVAFTAAWLVCTARQEGRDGYSWRIEHISGLGALEARDPALMNAGFVVLGACTLLFASAVAQSYEGERRAQPAPRLLRTAGAATLAAGVMRRDRMLLQPSDGAPLLAPSWHNRGHDLVSVIAYACMIVGPLILESHYPQDKLGSRSPGRVTSTVTAGCLALFASRLIEQHNGVLQRLAITFSLMSMARRGWWLLRRAQASTSAGGWGARRAMSSSVASTSS